MFQSLNTCRVSPLRNQRTDQRQRHDQRFTLHIPRGGSTYPEHTIHWWPPAWIRSFGRSDPIEASRWFHWMRASSSSERGRTAVVPRCHQGAEHRRLRSSRVQFPSLSQPGNVSAVGFNSPFCFCPSAISPTFAVTLNLSS